ncbi:SDR family NAD(P)-dependent oxidoreductase [Methylovirgula sp. 4M-Z18]|uniref:SDR family NAD(P)-dependent oxidoreductase n=1 Tax=Methylovirgula sp. 4M-Z18 TaxID=2293567 RepID=UPI000E2FDD5C|nr:SDR family NAD(P)-dependent oxidoreductase [Methylovirgula sp. 4M-Z18]RFB80698.1 SDR family NAD(P)-dependent oxidoreductase [Methylovirgula sp. 4M-Z18]
MSLPQQNRVALVTGASRGIGRALALALAAQGAHVIALARTQGALEELDDEIRRTGGEATLVPCDLRDFDALDRLGAAIHERWHRLDILIANAGILGPITPITHATPKSFADILDVNVTANWRLIRSLDMLLRASNAGRAIFISSGVAHRAIVKPFWGPYAISKSALEMLARTYAAETATVSNLKVMLVNPGPLRTDMRAQAMPGEDKLTLKLPEEIAPKIMMLCAPSWKETGQLYDFPTDRVLSFRGPE